VIEGRAEVNKPELTPEVGEEIRRLHRQGMSAKEAITQLSLVTGLSRKELYQAWLKL